MRSQRDRHTLHHSAGKDPFTPSFHSTLGGFPCLEGTETRYKENLTSNWRRSVSPQMWSRHLPIPQNNTQKQTQLFSCRKKERVVVSGKLLGKSFPCCEYSIHSLRMKQTPIHSIPKGPRKPVYCIWGHQALQGASQPTICVEQFLPHLLAESKGQKVKCLRGPDSDSEWTEAANALACILST